MDLDAAIAEATQEAANEQKASTATTKSVEATPQVTEAPIVPEQETPQETVEDIGEKPDSELTPEQLAKRDKNRQSHENSKLAKLRREIRELKAERVTVQSPKPSGVSRQEYQNDADYQADLERAQRGAPLMKDFKDYGAFLKADTLFDLRQEQKPQAQPDTELAQRMAEVERRSAEFSKQNPEYIELVKENIPFFGEVDSNESLRAGLAEAENPALSLFALMKEGRLDDLYDLSPTKLAAELAKAEIRGESYLNVRKATNAPTPITAAKGNSSGGKPLHLQSPDELMKHFGFK